MADNNYIYVHTVRQKKRTVIMIGNFPRYRSLLAILHISSYPSMLVLSSALSVLASSSNFCFVCAVVVICLEVVPSCPQNEVLVHVYCVKMTVENIPGDVKDWSISQVSLNNTRYVKVTITRTLQTIRLTAA